MRKFLVFNRIPLAILLLALGFYIGFAVTWWIAWIFLLVGLLMIAAHYLIGPMSLIQKFVYNISSPMFLILWVYQMGMST